MIPAENDAESDACDDTISSHSVDNAIKQQFEAAFATFLYKNPAFTSMSHANLSRLRAKLAKESAKNALAESELRRQLEELREAKRRNELELQRELLVVTRAKAAREAELRHRIWVTRQASMSMDEVLRHEFKANGIHDNFRQLQQAAECQYTLHSLPFEPYTPLQYSPDDSYDYGDIDHSPPISQLSWPHMDVSESFQEEIQKTRMEHARLHSEMEKLKQKIAESS